MSHLVQQEIKYVVVQADGMGATLGRAPRSLDQLPAEEVRLGRETHQLAFAGNSERLEIVLTRPLIKIDNAALLKVFGTDSSSSNKSLLYRIALTTLTYVAS